MGRPGASDCSIADQSGQSRPVTVRGSLLETLTAHIIGVIAAVALTDYALSAKRPRSDSAASRGRGLGGRSGAR